MTGKGNIQPGFYEVLWAPRERWPRLVRINASEFHADLADGLYPLGMIVRKDVSGEVEIEGNWRKYAVCGDGRERLVMDKAGWPDGYRLTRQTLASVNGEARV